MDILEKLEAFLVHFEVLGILQEVKSNEHLLLVGLSIGQVNDEGDLVVVGVHDHTSQDGVQVHPEGFRESLKFDSSFISLTELKGLVSDLAVQVLEFLVSGDDFQHGFVGVPETLEGSSDD